MPGPPPTPLPLLFTAFEPSADVLAARLIRELRRRNPQQTFVGFGGPQMEAAGCELLEETTAHAKMGVGVAIAVEGKTLLRRKGDLARWLGEHDIAGHVPVDSPAANWSMCRATRKARPQATIVHLVAPQLWAWAGWRIGRLRKLTDHLMCLLPFEPDWFGTRGVPGTFVGHPLFREATEAAANAKANAVQLIDDTGKPLASGDPTLALLPGSRAAEIDHNWPVMLAVFNALRHRHPTMATVVAAASPDRAKQIANLCPGGRPPRGVQVVTGRAGDVLTQADAALVVSGTATLEATARRTPCVAVYCGSRVKWNLLARWLVKTRTFALPNVIAQGMDMPRVVPEFVPHFGAPEPLVRALTPLLQEGPERAAQHAGYDVIHRVFGAVDFATAAADTLLSRLGSGTG